MNIDAAHGPANVSGWPPALIRGTADDVSQTDKTVSRTSPSPASQTSQRADGVGHAEQYQKTSDRDVDGRLPWQHHDQSGLPCTDDQSNDEPTDGKVSSESGECGGQLDVSG